MRILFASQSFYPHIGGVSTYLLNLCKELLRKGNDITEIHLRTAGEETVDEIEGIPIHRVPKEPIDKELLKGYSKFKEAVWNGCHGYESFPKPAIQMEGYEEFDKINTSFGEQVREMLEHTPAEIVHIQDFQLIFLYKFVPRGTPLVLTWHTPFEKNMPKELSKFLIKHMKEYDKVVFSSPHYIEAAVEAGLPRKKTGLIYPVANTELFTKLDIHTEAVKKRRNIPPNSKIILCVQRIDSKSGHEQLIRALPFVLEKVPEAKLVFVGGESMSNKLSKEREIYKTRIMDLIKELNLSRNIIFTGNIDYYALPELYNVAYLVALTSRLEGFGLSVTEGMSCGKPVIGTRIGGIPLQIEENRNGFLVDVGDYKATAGNMIALLTDNALRIRMGNESLKIVKEKFGVEAGIEKHLNLYSALLREKHEDWRLELLELENIDAMITDYDRTVTNTPGEAIPEKLIKELKSLKKKLILVTGRESGYVKDLCKKYPIWHCVVAENGAVIYFPKTSKTIRIDSEHVNEARELIKEKGIEADFGDVIISCPAEQTKKIKNVLGKLNRRLNFRLNVDKLMILPKEVDKGKGLAVALSYLNIKQEKTVIVGDGENDVDMFNVQGFKVALANAHPKLKKLANQITTMPSSEGVMEVINKLKQ